MLVAHGKNNRFGRERFSAISAAVIHELAYNGIRGAGIGHTPFQVGAFEINLA